jgi:membrane-associated phospholipid phosphatase
MVTSGTRSAVLFGISAVAALAYVAVSENVRRHKTTHTDRKLRRKGLKQSKEKNPVAHAAAEASGPLGKWYGHLPAALGTAWKFQREQRSTAAWAVVATSVAAILLSRVLERVMTHRSPPPGHPEPDEPSYPSGHALETTAVSIVSGYALMREGFASPGVTPLLAAAPVASGLGRLALDRHWASDALGGYCAGIALGAACAGVYEWRRSATGIG